MTHLIDSIFQADLDQPPAERSLPWVEIRDGVRVVIEPKPHWAGDMRAFRTDRQSYCYYADWLRDGPRARFYGHICLSGADILRKARTMIAREIADGLWSNHHSAE